MKRPSTRLIASGVVAVSTLTLAAPPVRADLFGITDSLILTEIIKEVVMLNQIMNDSFRIVSMTERAIRNVQTKQFWKTFGGTVANMEMRRAPSNTIPWQQTVNTNARMGGTGWSVASVSKTPPTFPVEADSNLASRLATSSIYDGSGAAALNTIGQARLNLRQNATAIDTIERDSLSNTAEENGEVQVLNTIQGASVANARLGQVQASAGVITAEQLTAQSKMWSDALNEHNNLEVQAGNAQLLGRGRASSRMAYTLNHFRER